MNMKLIFIVIKKICYWLCYFILKYAYFLFYILRLLFYIMYFFSRIIIPWMLSYIINFWLIFRRVFKYLYYFFRRLILIFRIRIVKIISHKELGPVFLVFIYVTIGLLYIFPPSL